MPKTGPDYTQWETETGNRKWTLKRKQNDEKKARIILVTEKSKIFEVAMKFLFQFQIIIYDT